MCTYSLCSIHVSWFISVRSYRELWNSKNIRKVLYNIFINRYKRNHCGLWIRFTDYNFESRFRLYRVRFFVILSYQCIRYWHNYYHCKENDRQWVPADRLCNQASPHYAVDTPFVHTNIADLHLYLLSNLIPHSCRSKVHAQFRYCGSAVAVLW